MLPFLLLFLLEAALRINGYGNNLSLFVEYPKYPSLLQMNSKVSLRYFVREEDAILGNIELFPKKKKKDAVRIFVQGESTAAGFPYFHNGSFSRMLLYRLQNAFPETEWEVINLSITALNSYALYDFADEIIAQRPDAVIINAGHNEYYGVLGVGSTKKTANSVVAGRLGIALRKTKTGQLLSKFISSLSQDDHRTDYDQTLMERMVKNQEIPLESKMYLAGITQFEKNLKGTLEKYHKAGVQVFLTNTVSNLKDQSPFISVLSESNPQPELWRTTLDAALERWKQQKDTVDMLQTIRQLHATDSCYALSWYTLGAIEYSQKNYASAKKAFQKAKELDALRFRAPQAINGIMRELSLKYDNVVLVDVKESFEKHSPNAIIGENLMLEHLHPNLRGHFVIANALFESLEGNGFKGITGQNTATFEEAWQSLPITEVDSLRGEFINKRLRRSWPFNESIPDDDKREKSIEETLAEELALRKIKWGQAMNQLLDHYTDTKQMDKVLKINEGIILDWSYEHDLYGQTVNICFHSKQYAKAIYYARKAYSLKRTSETAIQLTLLHLILDEPEKALPYLDYLIASDGNDDFKLMKDVAQKVIAAKKQLSKDPDNQAAIDEIYRLYMTLQNVEAAEKYKN